MQSTTHRSPTRMSLPTRYALCAVLILGSVIMLAPFLVMLVVSLFPNEAFLHASSHWTRSR
ncbi:MAG: hypothetical protein R2844_15440 [Caldilineales bacterium]